MTSPIVGQSWRMCVNVSYEPTLNCQYIWNEKMAGQYIASGQVSVDSAYTWSLLLCNGYQFWSSNVWVLQHHYVHALDMNTIMFFVYLGFQFKWNQLSSKQLLLYQLRIACWKVTWSNDLQTRFCQCTGIPQDRLHWNHTGCCYHPVVFHWQSSVN